MTESSYELSETVSNYSCRRKLASSSDSLKLATVLMYTVLIAHTVGFALPNWYKMAFYEISVGSGESVEQETYLVGLWKNCSCHTVEDVKVPCKCVAKDAFSGVLKTVQILETVGLIGFAISTLLCTLLLCVRHQASLLKGFNLLILISTDACATAGIVIFERDSIDLENTDGFSYRVSINDDDDSYYPEVRSYLTTSFILCAIAAGLCMFCIPVLLLDLCNRYPQLQDELRLIHMESIPVEQPFTIRKVPMQQRSSTSLLNVPEQPLT